MTPRLAFVLFGWLAGWYLCWRVPHLRLVTSRAATLHGRAGERPVVGVTVIVPARDEAASLPHLLAGLAAQDTLPQQVIVVDDGSSDGTGDIARTFAAEHEWLTVIDGAPLPAGWTGKAWACAQGAALARHDLLVFLDADVRPQPGALSALLAAYPGRGLLSVQPYHRMERPYERLSAVFNLVSVMGVGMASPGRSASGVATPRGAFGPCLVTRVADYELVGGHESVRGEVVEDLALGRAYRAAGLPVVLLGGGEVLAFRMYPGGPAQLFEGWTKNLATGAGTVGLGRTLLVGTWVTGALSALLALVDHLVGTPALGLLPATVAYGAYAAQLHIQLRPLGDFRWWTAVTYPVVFAAFLVTFLRSAWSTLIRRQVVWRGRAIPVARHRRWDLGPSPEPSS